MLVAGYIFWLVLISLIQLKGYYESNEDVNPPLKLEPCIIAQGDQVFLAEPLVRCINSALTRIFAPVNEYASSFGGLHYHMGIHNYRHSCQYFLDLVFSNYKNQ